MYTTSYVNYISLFKRNPWFLACRTEAKVLSLAIHCNYPESRAVPEIPLRDGIALWGLCGDRGISIFQSFLEDSIGAATDL